MYSLYFPDTEEAVNVLDGTVQKHFTVRVSAHRSVSLKIGARGMTARPERTAFQPKIHSVPAWWRSIGRFFSEAQDVLDAK
jgi:hypothetical protein